LIAPGTKSPCKSHGENNRGGAPNRCQWEIQSVPEKRNEFEGRKGVFFFVKKLIPLVHEKVAFCVREKNCGRKKRGLRRETIKTPEGRLKGGYRDGESGEARISKKWGEQGVFFVSELFDCKKKSFTKGNRPKGGLRGS